MERYTPEFLRALRQRYENTDQLMTSIAAEFEIGTRTLQRMVLKEGWRKRSNRTRGLPMAVTLLEEAKALASRPDHSRESGNPVIADHAKSETPGLLGPRLRVDDTPEHASSSAVDRIEALVIKEIEAEEAARVQLIGKRRMVGAAERSARTLATLTQTLHALQRMRAGSPPEQEISSDDDMPANIDEFRRDLASRIDAFVASRTDGGDAQGDPGPRPLDQA